MANAKWKESAGFLSQEPIEHTVNGNKVKFYPVSVGYAFKLKTLAKPIAAGLTVLFANEKNDTGTIERTVDDGREIIMEALRPEMADARIRQRQAAVEGIVDALMDESNRNTLGSLIIDSIYRGIWGSRDACPPAQEFMGDEGIPLPDLTDLLIGVALANKGIFGPLMGAEVQSRLGSALRDKLSIKTQGAAPEQADPSLNQ